ncbi:EAL domain-containing protein [Aeromonas piscicola]
MAKTAKKNASIVRACLVVISLMSIGLTIFYFDFIRSLQHKTDYATQQAISLLDQVFQYAIQTNQSMLNSADGQCQAHLPHLREEAALGPFIRTISLARKGTLYCSSLLGSVSANDDPELYVDGTLLLMPENLVRQHRPLVVVRLVQGDDSVLSAVDGVYIEMALRVARANTAMRFRVGPHELNDAGIFQTSPPATNAFMLSSLRSNQLPYSVDAEVSYKDAWKQFQHEYQVLGWCLVGLSIFAGIFYYRTKNKPASLQEDLVRGLREHEFVPFFQPQVDGVTKRVTGTEVLMRWQHPHDGLVRPDLFIPQAEESGLIIAMTSALFADVAKYFHFSHALFAPGFHISLNITANHLDSDVLLEDCRALHSLCKLHQWQLVLELTERSVLINTPDVANRLKALAAMGIMLALDDFGTGHSSLTTLQEFNFQIIKIDQSFVSRIGDEPGSQHIVDSVIALAKKMDLTLVAEGVETCEQAQYLANSGVELLQGYLFGAPVPPQAFLALIKEQHQI